MQRATTERKTVMNIRSPKPVESIPGFWTRMASANKRFLGLDYDGTLAPFRINRSEAYPLPGIVDSLKTISTSARTLLAIVSGRPIAELTTFLGDLHIVFVGCHGFELRTPHGKLLVMEPGKTQMDGLGAAKRLALAYRLGHSLETKFASVAVHTRGLPGEKAERIENEIAALWSGIASTHRLRCVHFKGGIELRADGWNKGCAVMALLSAAEADFGVYLGDDETDEDVFQFLRDGITGIKVGEPGVPTRAAGHLQNCWAVKRFLETWCSLESFAKEL